MTQTRAFRVLIVDDDDDEAEALGAALPPERFSCEIARSGPAAVRAAQRSEFDVVVSDVRMPGMTGLELLDELKKTRGALPVIMVTGRAGLAEAVEATKRGAFSYLAKPYELGDIDQLMVAAIQESRENKAPASTALGRRTTTTPPPNPHQQLFGHQLGDQLIGATPAMTELRDCIAHVAKSSAPALIRGETGSGKDVVARAIHAESPRRDQAFVALNVTAIPESMLESELFGHAKGAFTGAATARQGLFLEADGGTLFLDEIGDMPLGLQTKILRVVQFGEFRPLGSNTSRTVDVRILAATHRNLAALVAEGRFREDLYFRLNVLPVHVPALRERSADIADLAAHFLEQSRRRTPTSPVRALSDEATLALATAPWPGNVRQLAAAIERIVVFGHDELVTADTLASMHVLTNADGPVGATSNDARTIRQVTQAHVAAVLKQVGGNKARAAEILGVNLSTLYRWQHPDEQKPD